MSSYYEFKLPSKILSGDEALEHIPHELTTLGATRPLLLSDQGLEKVGTVETVQAALRQGGMTLAEIFCRIPADSSIEVVNEIVSLYHGSHCDSLIAVGGGSVIDTAKGVGMVLAQEGHDLLDSAGCEALPRGNHVPFVAVPTTAGTGSEATLVAVVANPKEHVKMEFVSYYLLPDVAVLDPRMTETLPPRVTASTGFDALVHAIEAATCLQRNLVSDSFAEKAISQIAQALPRAVENGKDRAARMAMANGSLLAGAAFSNSMVGLVHAIGHALGGVCHVAHGEAMTILLPAVMKYNLSACKERYGELLLYLAGPEVYAQTPKEDRANAAIRFLTELRQSLAEKTGLPITLVETGKVRREDFEEVAYTALNDGAIIVNPVQADFEDIVALLEEVWS
jgi:alcohol dehydrogenase